MRKPNPSIGTAPCPVSGCSAACTVHKFERRAASDDRQRKAGKLYLRCPAHGRIGFDGDAWVQEWVLERITWAEGEQPITPKAAAPADASSGSRGTEAAPRSLPAGVKKPAPSGAAKSSGTSTGKQTQTAPAAKRPWWEDLP